LERIAARAAIVCVALAATPSYGQQAGTADEKQPPAAAEDYVYRIAPGDVLDLKFSSNPDMDDAVTVRSDGWVTLRMVGEVLVVDKSTAELTREVTERYREYLTHPEVAVGLKQSANLQVYVGGEVISPSKVPLEGSMTALQALLTVGGPRISAKLKEVAWVRKTGVNDALVRTLDIKAIMRGEAPDPLLQPHDILFVSRSNIGAANRFVEEFVNGLLPRGLVFAYNLNTNFRVE
jgi:polysaccharide export outer membrane protein